MQLKSFNQNNNTMQAPWLRYDVMLYVSLIKDYNYKQKILLAVKDLKANEHRLFDQKTSTYNESLEIWNNWYLRHLVGH